MSFVLSSKDFSRSANWPSATTAPIPTRPQKPHKAEDTVLEALGSEGPKVSTEVKDGPGNDAHDVPQDRSELFLFEQARRQSIDVEIHLQELEQSLEALTRDLARISSKSSSQAIDAEA